MPPAPSTTPPAQTATPAGKERAEPRPVLVSELAVTSSKPIDKGLPRFNNKDEEIDPTDARGLPYGW